MIHSQSRPADSSVTRRMTYCIAEMIWLISGCAFSIPSHLAVMTKIYATLGRKFNKEDLEKAAQASHQLEQEPRYTPG